MACRSSITIVVVPAGVSDVVKALVAVPLVTLTLVTSAMVTTSLKFSAKVPASKSNVAVCSTGGVLSAAITPWKFT